MSTQTDQDRGFTGRMDRVTFRAPKEQLDELEDLVDDGLYPNQSEAIRDAVRDLLEDHR